MFQTVVKDDFLGMLIVFGVGAESNKYKVYENQYSERTPAEERRASSQTVVQTAGSRGYRTKTNDSGLKRG